MTKTQEGQLCPPREYFGLEDKRGAMTTVHGVSVERIETES